VVLTQGRTKEQAEAEVNKAKVATKRQQRYKTQQKAKARHKQNATATTARGHIVAAKAAEGQDSGAG